MVDNSEGKHEVVIVVQVPGRGTVRTVVPAGQRIRIYVGEAGPRSEVEQPRVGEDAPPQKK